MTKTPYPPRLWALQGYPGSGKSTFATQMRGPLLVIDADQRFREVLELAGERDVYQLSDVASDNTDPDRVTEILARDMPGSDIGTIVVDSLTTIISPIVTQTLVDKDHGRTDNLAAGWREKALAMRQLQDAVTRWGVDVLWIWHLSDYRDAKAKAGTRATLPRTERARLTRSLNVQLEIVQDGDRRGVKVLWARRGRSGGTLWDDSGRWAGIPEALEEEIYGGLSESDQERIEAEPPDVFPDPASAIAWGLEQGAFKALQHSRNAYDKLKAEEEPKDAQEMRDLWLADVERRLAELEAEEAGSEIQEELEL
jgi:hypothetical protein